MARIVRANAAGQVIDLRDGGYLDKRFCVGLCVGAE
jgi:hypothetical protein